MREDAEFLDRWKEAIRRSGDLPWEEFIAPLVAKGICDEDGNVLVCMPPPPRTVYDEDGNATIILPDLSQPPPPPIRRNQPKAKPRDQAKGHAPGQARREGQASAPEARGRRRLSGAPSPAGPDFATRGAGHLV